MNISTYAEQARSTAIYTGPVSYPSHGLAGEVGELIDKLTLIPHQPKDEVQKEVGDVLWYIVNTAADAGLSFQDICEALTGGLRADNFTELAHQMKPRQDTRSAMIKLPIYAGRVNEVAKKMLRDSGGHLPKEKKPIVFDGLVEVLSCLVTVCQVWALNLDDVAQANIEKLFSRKERGVLQGSGDNR